ncbi:MAG: glutamate--tRNA ligase [Myxococcota bacterium]
MTVVTRYAPSPTGALHIGGARTALFNWAYARRHGGRYLLRVEDTDRTRSSAESERAVLEAFEWLGLDWDPVPGFAGIPRQSERGARYREVLESLLARGLAYRCTCTPEDLERMRARARSQGRTAGYDGTCRDRAHGPDLCVPYCIRLRVPEEGAATRWRDLIAGPSGQDAEDVGDFVIARSDGSPIYHLAVVVDDHDMAVTHVIRGREHMTSTPRQLLLYQALDWKPPQFAHVPLLVEPGGKKLSKRHAAVSVQSYRDRGFTPEAVLNFIARLGWSDGDLEIFSRDELAARFDLSQIGRSASQVHEDKLVWLSQHYLRTLPAETLHRYVQPFLEARAGRPVAIDAGLARILELLRERSRTLVDMAEGAEFYWLETLEPDPRAARKFLTESNRAPLRDLVDALRELDRWTEPGLQSVFERVLEEREIGLGKLAQPVRVAVTGRAASPGIYKTLAALGREKSLRRLEAALARLGSAAS